MNIAAFIFAYKDAAPLLAPCIRALRRNPGEGNTLKVHVVDDSLNPLDAGTRAALAKDGVTVLETTSPRHGNLRGFAIVREMAQLMAANSKDAAIVVRLDPDALVADLAAFVQPLVDAPAAGMSGHNFHDQPGLCLGQAYALRKATLDFVAATLAGIDGSAAEFAVDYLHLRHGWEPTMLWEDFTTSAIAGRHAPVAVNRIGRTSWEHFGEQRDPGEVTRGHALVLVGNPPKHPEITGDNAVLAACAEMLLAAADDKAGPQPVLPEGAKPLVLIGLGAGRVDTAALAATLAAQPGVCCLHEAFATTSHTVAVDPDMNARAHWRRWKRHLQQATLPVWGNVCLTNAWRVEELLPHLAADGYDFRIVALDRVDADRLASWTAATDARKEVMFGGKPSSQETAASFRVTSWSHATPEFPGATREARISAAIADYRKKVAALTAAHPQKVRALPAADLGDRKAMAALLDWLGLPAAGRRFELVGAKVSQSAPAGD